MIKLDWQTEVEEWEPDLPAPEPPEPSGRRDSWRFLLAALFLLSATLLLVGRRVSLQVQQAEEATEEAVLAAHRLLLEAADEQDDELFGALMTGRDTWWRNAQLDMVKAGTLTDRQPLGLDQVEPVTEAAVTTLSPDLDQAEVSFPVVYVVDRPDSLTETVTLEQTMTFIQVDGEWRYTRPDIDAWGEWQQVERDRISVSYREIEGELGARLATDLIAAINDMCLYTGACPPETELIIRLEETLNGLPQVSRSIHPGETRISIGLPTPLLVGRPADEAAYQALRRGYARHILTFLILRWDAPDTQASMETYHDALLRRRFVDLGLAGWPPPADSTDVSPPYPLPDQNLATICVAEPDQGSELAIYDVAAEQWPLSMVTKPLSQLYPLPDDSGVLLLGPNLSGGHEQSLSLWRPDAPMIELGSSLGVSFVRGGQGGIIHILDRGYGWSAFYVPDFRQCTPAGCRLQQVPFYYAQWSPDGRYLLYLDMESERYFVRDLETGTQRILTSAISAYWADENTIALVRSERPSRTARRITLFDVPWGEQRDLVAHTDLLIEMPDIAYPERGTLYVSDVLAWPGRPNTYLVAAFPQDPISSFITSDTTRYILAVETGRVPQVEHLATIQGQVFAPLEASPNGRWLTLPNYSLETNTTHLTLLNLEGGQNESYSFPHDQPYVFGDHDWSADGNWLVIADSGVLTLVAPGTGYQKEIYPPTAGCAFAAFMNP